MMDLFWGYLKANASKKDAKDYGNVIHPNMFAGRKNIDESTPIIEFVPPPELHLLIVPLKTLYDELEKVWPQCIMFIERLYIKREEYHEGSFNGNDSRKLLNHISILEEIAPADKAKVENFIKRFKDFDNVVSSSYGRRTC